MFTLFKSGRTGKYYAQYLQDGRKIQFSCKTSNARTARQFAIAKLSVNPDTACKGISLSLKDYTHRYLEAVRPALSHSTMQSYEQSLRLFLLKIGNVRLSYLTVEACHNFVYDGKRSLHSSAKHYRQLRRAFRLAVKWKLLDENPFDQVDRPKPTETKKDFFTESEFTLFLRSLPESSYEERRFKRLVMLGRLTGMRASEMIHLKEEHIDWDRNRIHVMNTDTFRTKSRRNRSVPLANALSHLLKEQLSENRTKGFASYLFPSNTGQPQSIYTLSERFKDSVRPVLPEKKRLCLHSLRSTFITQAYIDGVPPQQIQLAVGHKTIQTTEGYAHLHAVRMDGLLASLDKSHFGTNLQG